MEAFLNRLAERKYGFYHSLYVAVPQAYTSEECFDRIQKKAKYQEIIDLIAFLPLEQERKVNERFEEMKSWLNRDNRDNGGINAPKTTTKL